MEYLRYLLRSNHQGFQVLQGQQVELTCHQDALRRIQNEAPTSVIKWSLNGVDVSQEGTRVVMNHNKNLRNLILYIVHTHNLFNKFYFYATNMNYYKTE